MPAQASCPGKLMPAFPSGSTHDNKAGKSTDTFCYVQGLVKAVGVSNYGPRQLERIHKYLTERGVPLASAQVSSFLAL